MTDQTIPADQARRARQWARDTLDDVENGANVSAYARDAARTLIAMMPRPTLADMTPVARRECQWMQCEVNGELRVITLIREGNDHAVTLAPSGFTFHCPPEKVTPRPDLPRMEWPSTGQDGEEATKVDYVSVAGGRTAYGPWTVARLRKKPAPAPVPPNTLTEGSEWDNVDALARACEESGRTQITAIDREGDVSVWDASAENWHGPHPIQAYAPFTITHTGRKANQ